MTARTRTGRKPTRAKTARARRIYFFGGGRADGRANMVDRLGGKGANLAEMVRLGIPVPPGFTIGTEACHEFRKRSQQLSRALQAEIRKNLGRIEKLLDAGFGDPDRPLLVSVRSGARVSMPGMMDTILNLGLNDHTVRGLASTSGDERFALDSYRRFIQMYGEVVLGVPAHRFESQLERHKRERGIELDTDLSAFDLWELVECFKGELVEEGVELPQEPYAQLHGAIAAVFRSWDNERAVRYRAIHDFDDSWGTAVNVQAMVFGNMGGDSATGVAFTRNPSTGERMLYGEYLKNAQGEDVVAGVRTPIPINRQSAVPEQRGHRTLEQEMPSVFTELARAAARLERHYKDMQDIEFTIERGRLWLLQTRSGKRTAQAAIRIAVELAKERRITRAEAVARVDPSSLEQLLHPTLDPSADRTLLGRGLPASPGAASGRVALDADTAESLARAGDKVILVRVETSPEDIHGMHAAAGILTARGGMTSHAAVVARGMGRCCVVGCSELRVDAREGSLQVGNRCIRAGDVITLNGATGEIFAGELPTLPPKLGGAFDELMSWADRLRRMRVRANADNAQDATAARGMGAEGIGLCRTEHMFFEPDRIHAMRRMILADSSEDRAHALEALAPMQQKDFEALFEAMDGLPVTIRLLDPPLHEFLPTREPEILSAARELGVPAGALRAKLEALHEWNPMLGHRGCRLGLTFPEIYRMQARAIALAVASRCARGRAVKAEVMVPLVADAEELARVRESIAAEIDEVLRSVAGAPRIPIGTMIEVPRAALTADAIALRADFFSFGTNDLTQMGFALSRDDAGKFLAGYVEEGILSADPFVSIDRDGIGALVEQGVAKGREAKPKLKIGICGEHGGDPRSIHFFDSLGMDYVSCSPFRVPVARLAAAQAAAAHSAAGRRRGKSRER